jgi:ribose 5-phosphate isomerase RpiB
MIEKPTPKVQMVLSALAREGLSLVNFTQTDCPVRNLRSLCEGVAAGQVRVGLAILPFAADAMLLANKVRGVRAVQGARPQSVAAALRHYHANVLVLEHAASTLHEMLTMIRLFAAGPSALPNAKVLLAAIGELEK